MSDRYSILEFSLGMYVFLISFPSILPVVPTECDVLIVCRQHNDKAWKFKEQHAKMWENIAEAKRHSRLRRFNIAGASAPVALAVIIIIYYCNNRRRNPALF